MLLQCRHAEWGRIKLSLCLSLGVFCTSGNIDLQSIATPESVLQKHYEGAVTLVKFCQHFVGKKNSSMYEAPFTQTAFSVRNRATNLNSSQHRHGKNFRPHAKFRPGLSVNT